MTEKRHHVIPRQKRRVSTDHFNEAPLPAPTEHEPGTRQKMSVLRSRVDLEQTLFHPDDAKPSTLRRTHDEQLVLPTNDAFVPTRDLVVGEEPYAEQRRQDEDEEPAPADPEPWEVVAAANRARFREIVEQRARRRTA